MPLYKDANNQIHDDMDGAAKHLLPAGCIQITQAEADALRAPTQSQIRSAFIASAKQELNSTDLVCLRCYKAGVVFPVEWQNYTTKLRNIVNGSDIISTTLPTKPTYPAGT